MFYSFIFYEYNTRAFLKSEVRTMDLFSKYNHPLLEMARKEGIYPYFHELQSRQAPEVVMEGHRIIMLGSNNYLGLTENQNVIDAGIKALEKYGSGCSGSRFLNGTLDLHKELEGEIAKFLHKEDAVVFSTGFQSNLGIISALAGFGDYILNDRENHASIYDACKLSYAKVLRYRHSDMEDLEAQLKSIPQTAGILIVTDGVFSMRGDICKLPEICALAKKYGARVMVDDAHSLGVLGEGGRGTASYFGLEDQVDVIMNTFSKSLASIGGCMAASKKVCDYVRHVSRPFIFSASLTPASTASALQALRELEARPEMVTRLKELGDYCRDAFRKRGLQIVEASTPIVPIYTYTARRTFIIAQKLFEKGVYVNPVVSPAAPEGECLLRVTLMATHNEKLIDEAADIIAEVVNNEKTED